MSNRYGSSNNNFDDGSPHFRHHRPSTMNGHNRPQDAFDSPPRQFRGGGGAGFPPSGGGSRPMGGAGGGGRGFGQNYQLPPQHQQGQVSGQKRGFPFSVVGGSPSYDRFDGGAYAKLFVGSVPRTATEEDIRPLFEEHGHVIEVALIKDRRTGQQQGCCFIKYSSSEEADRAIRALHNQRTIPGGAGPIQVRYADGERERLGAVEYKLFVGSLNKQATEKEVEEIFLPYGRVEDVYLMRDEFKQSRGCGFVKYTHRDMALAAINALNGKYTMRGCDQPITVRFADPKRPRQADSRNGPAFGGPGVGPRFDAPGVRPALDYGYPTSDQVPPSGLHPMSGQHMGPTSNVVIHGLGNQPLNRSAATEIPPNPGVKPGNSSRPPEYPHLGPSSLTSQQLPSGQQISPLQKSFHSPQHNPSLQLYSRDQIAYSQTATSLTLQRQTAQLKSPPSAAQAPINQALPQKPLPGSSGCYSAQLPIEQSASSAAVLQTPANVKLDLQATSGTINRQQLTAPVQPHLAQPSPQPSSQLAQLISQQTETLKASFQSSQQAFTQLQQQLQQMQPSNQNLSSQQNPQAIKQQSQWAGSLQQGVASIHTASANIHPAMSGDPAAPILAQTVPLVRCNWTEHTSPDGYKYYYNSITNESKWEKPEEFAVFEQQQKSQLQLQQQQQQQIQFHQIQPTQQVSQTHIQLQTHPRPQQSSYQPTSASLYQTSGYMGQQSIQEIGYKQLQAATRTVGDPANLQQGHHAVQEWGWRDKPAGT